MGLGCLWVTVGGAVLLVCYDCRMGVLTVIYFVCVLRGFIGCCGVIYDLIWLLVECTVRLFWLGRYGFLPWFACVGCLICLVLWIWMLVVIASWLAIYVLVCLCLLCCWLCVSCCGFCCRLL